MKRYLIKGALALIAGLFITSCSHETKIDYVPVEEQKAKEFEEAFKEVFTKNIDPNQDWGYTPAYLLLASTRVADPKSNMWAEEGYTVPMAITPTEKALVLKHFSEQGAENYTWLVDWSEFFVQQVYKGVASYTAGNGGTVIGGNQMDWLCAGSDSMGDDHVNNFNNADGSIMLMVKSSTQRFGFKSSTDNGHVFHNFRMVNGADIDASLAGAYYVGLDFEANGQNPNEQVARDYIYNDWIVKIVPGKGSTVDPSAPTFQENESKKITKIEYFRKRYLKDYGRVFCEDLSRNYTKDFTREDLDYNDVVFDARIWEEVEWKTVTVSKQVVVTTKIKGTETVVSTETKTYPDEITTSEVGTPATYYAEICLIATGATLPVRVGGPDAIEVHKAFGDYSVDCMINTFDNYTAEEKKGFGYHKIAEPVYLDWIDVTSFMKEKKTVSDIPVYVQWGGIAAGAVTADKGAAPGKFTIREKINWASERANLSVGYPLFTNWVEGSSPDFWTGVNANQTAGLYSAGYPSYTVGPSFDRSEVNQETRLNVTRIEYQTEKIDGETEWVEDEVELESGDVLIQNGPITGYTVLGNSLFSDVKPKDGDEIHFYCDYTTDYWQIMTWDNHYGSSNSVPNWGNQSNVSNSTANAWGTSRKYVVMQINSTLASMLTNYGIKIQPDRITIKAVAYKSN